MFRAMCRSTWLPLRCNQCRRGLRQRPDLAVCAARGRLYAGDRLPVAHSRPGAAWIFPWLDDRQPRSARGTAFPERRAQTLARRRISSRRRSAEGSWLLVPAYDDTAGVTAAFNNLLVRSIGRLGPISTSALRASRGLERCRKPHRDAPGQPRDQAVHVAARDRLCRGRDDPHREQLQVPPERFAALPERPAGRSRECGPIPDSCSRCIGWGQEVVRDGAYAAVCFSSPVRGAQLQAGPDARGF